MGLALVAALSLPGCVGKPRTTATLPTRPDPVAQAITTDFTTHTTDDQIRAVIVTVAGRTRFERYYHCTPDQTRSVFSVTKSVFSTLIGIAVAQGKLRLDERLAQMLPRYASLMTPRVAAVTLRQLLTMSGGFTDTWSGGSYDAYAGARDWVRYILTKQDTPPGKVFAYSDYGVHLLSAILVQATGQPVLDYARTYLFDPLGIPTAPATQVVADAAHLPQYKQAGFAWPTDPQGFTLAATYLKIRPRDMARFGQLFLQGGQWSGKQLVPATWVRQATTAQAGPAFANFQSFGSFQPTNYGYLWWVAAVDHAATFFAHGLGGQLIEVVPVRQLVIVISTYVNLSTGTEIVGPDDEQRIATAVVHAVMS